MTSDELDRLEATVRGANPVPYSAGLSDSAEAAAVTLLIREATKRDCTHLRGRSRRSAGSCHGDESRPIP